MSGESVEEIKERLKVEIPVEVEEEEVLKVDVEDDANVVDELSKMGRKFAETLQSAWDSEERTQFETEVREGVKSFADEVDKVIRELRASAGGEKAKTAAEDVRAKVETKVDVDDISKKARTGIVTGLRWFSEELGKLADQFTPDSEEPVVEKSPEDVS